MVRMKRAYEAATAEDGFRVLVDRLWPRGLAKDAASVDLWLKEVAPSPGLRRWFGHDATRFTAFRARYHDELDAPERATALERLRAEERRHGTITLLFAARDETHNHARVLLELLTKGG